MALVSPKRADDRERKRGEVTVGEIGSVGNTKSVSFARGLKLSKMKKGDVMKARSIDHNESKSTKVDTSKRRNFLKATGAAFVAASVPSVAAGALKGAQSKEEDPRSRRPRPVYLSGCGWNRALPGVFGEVCLTFDMTAELGSTGVGTFRDDVHPEINSQFQINSATRRRDEYTFEGEIIASRDPAMVGLTVRIVAEPLGDGKGTATIIVETDNNLVVIAIIAVLIGLLLPDPRNGA